MNGNAKNHLLELLKNLGCSEDCAVFRPQLISSGLHKSTVVVNFPDGRTVQGTGMGSRETDADISAAHAAIEQLQNEYPDLIVDWDEIKVQAQAGDALIKLGIYLSADIKRASANSLQLQRLESDFNLAQVFDQWRAQNDPDLACWGPRLGEKRKATLVEALLWQRFGQKVITADMFKQLQALIKTLTIESVSSSDS
jgi:hypothetical protein